MSNCKNAYAAIITPVLAAGSTQSPYNFEVNISQRLCHKTCETPIFNPTFTLQGYSSLGNGMYVATILVQGLIAYVPCNGCTCGTVTQGLSQVFTLPFYTTETVNSVSIQAGTTTNAIANSPCNPCSRAFVSETPIALAVTTA